MHRQNFSRYLVVAVLAVIVAVGAMLAFGLAAPPENDSYPTIHLKAPPFMLEAHAEGQTPAANFLEEEAGIAAYMKSSYSINLDDVRGLFRTIEDETSDYIIGSIEVADNPEEKDVHVYINRNGWIVAYYLKDDPVGKILNWPKYKKNGNKNMTTMLGDAVAYIAGEASLPYRGVTYYHFHYPNATQIILIIEYNNGGYYSTDSFGVTLPADFIFFERSWSLMNCSFSVDGAKIGDSKYQEYGVLNATQLSAGEPHTLSVYTNYGYVGYGALALTYRRP